MTEPQCPFTGPELDREIADMALRYPQHGPDEFVPWMDRISLQDSRRAVQLQSARHQIDVDNLAAELWPARQAELAGEITETRDQAEAGEMWPDIGHARDPIPWRVRQTRPQLQKWHELEAGA
jgi:hypothetical protein